MSTQDKNEIKRLINIMSKADAVYWNATGNTKEIISDGEYDNLYAKLKQYHNEYPDNKAIIKYFGTMHHAKNNTFAKIHHPYHVISLAKIRQKPEIEHFLNKWNTDKSSKYYTDGFLVQSKEDGLSTVVYFNDPRMPHKITFLTRGSGVYGNDVSNELYYYNLMNINKIAKRVGNSHIVVRGESLISRGSFKHDSAESKTGFENERNLVSGSVMNKNPQVVGKRGVFLSAYSLLNRDEYQKQLPTEMEQLKFMRDLGFSVTTNTHYFPNTKQGKSDLLHFILNFSHVQRLAVGHDIDGLVIKPNYTANFEKIGWTAHNPRYADAYKFPSQQALTRVKNIRYQVSANGKLTPVIIFEHPVRIFGANIAKCTGGSLGNMKKYHIMINGYITVKRMNDVIPKAFGVPSLNQSVMNLHTPASALPKSAIKKGKFYYIPKSQMSNSLPVLINRWSKFVSKPCLNIMGLSDKVISTLIKHHLIDPHDFSSLWKINHHDFIKTPSFAEKGWQNLQTQLKQAKSVPLARVLLGLPIANAGLTIYRPLGKLVHNFKPLLHNQAKLNQMKSLLLNKLPKIKGLGKSTIPVTKTLFSTPIIQQLKHLAPYLDLVDNQPTIHAHASKITGKNFVITGSLSKPRKVFKNLIATNGATLKSGISGTTDYLICNQPSNSSKYKKAVAKHIPIINEQQFLSLLK